MYQRILVPVDGSQRALNILPLVMALAKKDQTEVNLLRIVQEKQEQERLRDELNELAQHHGAKAIMTSADLKIDDAIRKTAETAAASRFLQASEDDIAGVILKEAQRVPDTLIAMTSRGHSGLLETLLGNVAMRVVRGSNEPVLIYRAQDRPGADTQAPSHIILPMDGSQLSEAIGHAAARWARWLGAQLFVVNVIDSKTHSRAKANTSSIAAMESSYVATTAQKLGKEFGISVNWDTLHGSNPAQAIIEFIKGHPSAVLAMSTRAPGAAKATFLGSTTAACLRKSGAPILMLAPKD